MFARNLLLAAGMLGLLAVAAQAAPIFVDLQGSGAETEPGYTAVLTTNGFNNNSAVTLATGEQIGWQNTYQGGAFNRTNVSQYPTANAMHKDGVYFSPGIVKTLQIKSLAPGLYDLTLFGIDPQYKDKKTQFDIDQDDNGLADQTVVIEWKDLGEVSKTVQVNVSSGGVLSITAQKYGNGAQGAFNGFHLVAVPEPATMLILLAGMGLAAVRRR